MVGTAAPLLACAVTILVLTLSRYLVLIRDVIRTTFSWHCSGTDFLHEASRWSQFTRNLARAGSLFKKLFAGPSPPDHGFGDDSNDFENTRANDNFENAGEDEGTIVTIRAGRRGSSSYHLLGCFQCRRYRCKLSNTWNIFGGTYASSCTGPDRAAACSSVSGTRLERYCESVSDHTAGGASTDCFIPERGKNCGNLSYPDAGDAAAAAAADVDEP